MILARKFILLKFLFASLYLLFSSFLKADYLEDLLSYEGSEAFEDYLSEIHSTILDTTVSITNVAPFLTREEYTRILAIGPVKNINKISLEDLEKISIRSEKADFITELLYSTFYLGKRHPWIRTCLVLTRGREDADWENDSSLRPYRALQRTRIQISEGTSFSFISEKDRGEKSLLDHAQAFVQIDHIGAFSNIVLGDFQPGFAQGLIFSRWDRRYWGVSDIMEWDRKLIGSVSSSENRAFRGVYASFMPGSRKEKNNIKITGFLARTNREATLTEEGKVKTLDTEGRHITNEDNPGVIESLVGGRLVYTPLSRLTVGFTHASWHYSKGFTYDLDTRTRDRFTGSSLAISGIDGIFDLNRAAIFWEVAIEHGGVGDKYAVVAGIITKKLPVELSILQHFIGKDYHSFYGNGFRSGRGVSGSIGTFIGLGYYPSRRFELEAYKDSYRTPYRTYMMRMPVLRSVVGGRLRVSILKRVSISFKSRVSVSEKVYTFSKDYETRWKRGIDVEHKGVRKRFRGRLEVSRYAYSGENERGILGYVDGELRPVKWLLMGLRSTWFFTDGYGSRLSMRDRDIPSSALIESFWGSGYAVSIIFGIKNNYIQAWVRYRNIQVHSRERSMREGNFISCEIRLIR